MSDTNKAEIDALQAGDTVQVNFGMCGNWLPVKLNDAEHLQRLIDYYGYNNLRL